MKSIWNGMAWATALCLATAAGSAQDLAARDKIAQDKTNLAQYATRVNSACGTHIAFSIDYASYTGKTPAAGVRQQSYEAYLENAGDALINICVTPAGKAAVAQKIHAVRGGYAESEQYTLAGGVFTYKTGFGGGSVAAPEKYLKAQL